METELIKNKVYYKILDKTYTASSGKYNILKAKNQKTLSEIQHNIEIIKQEHSADDLIILTQVHGNKIVDIDNTENPHFSEADGAITTKKGVALGIITADCVPVLMTSEDGNIIGAAHCGWKSAKSDIIDELYRSMQSKGARTIKALIGPSIQQKSYEVDESYFQSFIKDDIKHKEFFINSNKNGHYMFDLPAYVCAKILRNNIEIIVNIDEDTYEFADKYPSCRRSAHKNEIYNQNILSTIILR